jgi:hypothetical protein
MMTPTTEGDEYFSDKSQGSKTTNASSLATVVSDSANGEGIKLVAGCCRARTQAQKYNDHWVICTGPVHAIVQGIRAREGREPWANQASMLHAPYNHLNVIVSTSPAGRTD